MALLLDTHAFVWWLEGERKLSVRARRAIEEAEHVLVSAATAWEIATKHRLGKLTSVGGIVNDIAGVIAAQTFETLDVTVLHAQRAGLLHIKHKDPFDRLLIAQARSESLTLVSNEKLFDTFGVDRLW